MTAPERISRLLKRRWFRMVVITLWVLSGLWTLERGWVWESWEYFPGGGFEHRQNYFYLDRKPLFIATSVLIAAYAISRFRESSRSHFGLFQLACGFVGAYLTLRFAPIGSIPSWLALAGALTLCASGFENLAPSAPAQALKCEPTAESASKTSPVERSDSPAPIAQNEIGAQQGETPDGASHRRSSPGR